MINRQQNIVVYRIIGELLNAHNMNWRQNEEIESAQKHFLALIRIIFVMKYKSFDKQSRYDIKC